MLLLQRYVGFEVGLFFADTPIKLLDTDQVIFVRSLFPLLGDRYRRKYGLWTSKLVINLSKCHLHPITLFQSS